MSSHLRNGIPGEFEPHYGTIIMYPVRTDIWRENAKYMQEYIMNLVHIISKYERVYLICPYGYAKNLKDTINANVALVEMEYDDIWARDIAPTFIYKEGMIKTIDWRFNAWGGVKEGAYFPWDKDDSFASAFSDFLNLESVRAPITLEGGAVISDGNGTLFATRSVLLNRNRNPFKSLEYVENKILETTGDCRIIWLKQGLSHDETNGHIDNILSVISDKDICLAWTEDKNNPNYKRVREAYSVLKDEQNINGIKYNIHLIPLPTIQRMSPEEADGLIPDNQSLDRNAGDILPASYLNFYMLNGAVIIPAFGCDEDEEALYIFKNLLKNKEVIQIYSREPLLGGGGIHCILHEIPMEYQL